MDVWLYMAGVVCGLLAALLILLVIRVVSAFYRVERENRRLRADLQARQEQEHERLARQAARRAGAGDRGEFLYQKSDQEADE